jgi:hypothetical protein
VHKHVNELIEKGKKSKGLIFKCIAKFFGEKNWEKKLSGDIKIGI